MDIIILGILMLGNWTIYEIHKMIETNFTSMSSSSMGSIQTAIKKLLGREYITYREYVENSVNKKAYAITEAGKRHFLSNVAQPMRYKEKSMEWCKFFFLGFVSRREQAPLLEAYIGELEKEAGYLRAVQAAAEEARFDGDYVEMLRQKGAAAEVTEPRDGAAPLEHVKEIAKFQLATLELGIAKVEFEIQWFREFIERLITDGNGTAEDIRDSAKELQEKKSMEGEGML